MLATCVAYARNAQKRTYALLWSAADGGWIVKIEITRLSSGYYHIRGIGVCNFAQPPEWPCSEEMLREHAFGQASEVFVRAALALTTPADGGDDHG